MPALDLSRHTVQDSPKVVTVRIAGEVDYIQERSVEVYFNDMLQAEQPRHVFLDLGGLTFAATPFIGSLLFWKEELAHRGGLLVLFGLSSATESLIRLVKLNRVLTVCADEQEALKVLPGR